MKFWSAKTKGRVGSSSESPGAKCHFGFCLFNCHSNTAAPITSCVKNLLLYLFQFGAKFLKILSNVHFLLETLSKNKNCRTLLINWCQCCRGHFLFLSVSRRQLVCPYNRYGSSPSCEEWSLSGRGWAKEPMAETFPSSFLCIWTFFAHSLTPLRSLILKLHALTRR